MSDVYSVKEMFTEIRLDQKEHNARSVRMEQVQEQQGKILEAVLVFL